jgi:hypothetical protein
VAHQLLLYLLIEGNMKNFFYENVSLAPVSKISNAVNIDRYLEAGVLKKRKRSVDISGEEFLDVLKAALDEQDRQEVIQANQMALRRE